jgi:hypothetical protein
VQLPAPIGRRAPSGQDPVLAQAIALLLAGALLVALTVFILPAALVDADDVRSVPERLDLQNNVRATLLQGLGGAFLFLTAFFTYRQMATARAQLEETTRHQRQQEQHDERGQITDRFSRAIDQLGEESNLVERLGGIYALETVARDSKAMTQLVEEVLCAFIRQRAPWPPAAGQPGADTPPEELGPLRLRLPDVASALLVLSRRESADNDAVQAALWPLDLSGVDLRGADLAAPPMMDPTGLAVKGPVRGSNLRHAFLAGSSLAGARLDGADLTRADLRDTDLRGASLADAHLEGAVLAGARLEGALLIYAHLDPGAPDAVLSHDAKTVWPADMEVD